jgi:four helix bundle protein
MLKTSYQKLTVFQKAKELVLLVYKTTKKYPREEQFSLVSQMRRAAISILANIVDGYSRDSTKEYVRFINISIGSATELRVFIEISRELGYINSKSQIEMDRLLDEVMKLLYSYRKTLRKKLSE